MAAHRAPEILKTNEPARFKEAVQRAAEWLRRDEVVALPTETVYGLAANALSTAAVQRIYAVKGRPAHNPVIVHVHGVPMARACTAEWPAAADQLAAAFWPGALTFVLRRAPHIPDIVTAGGDTVAVRWPSHPFIQAVIAACEFPLAAPSANRSNEISPTCATHVLASLGDRVPLIVDGGVCQVGIESTVVDLTSPTPRVLRPGMISAAAIAAVVGPLAGSASTSPAASPTGSEPLRSPGLLSRHYAPRARVLVLPWREAEDLAATLESMGLAPGGVHVVAHSHLPLGAETRFAGVSLIPHDPEAYARALYGEWHRLDETGVRVIAMEAVPDEPEWQGIADRLRRASTAA